MRRTHPWLAGPPDGMEYWRMWMPRSFLKLDTHRISHSSPGGLSLETRSSCRQLKLKRPGGVRYPGAPELTRPHRLSRPCAQAAHDSTPEWMMNHLPRS